MHSYERYSQEFETDRNEEKSCIRRIVFKNYLTDLSRLKPYLSYRELKSSVSINPACLHSFNDNHLEMERTFIFQ